MRELPGAVQDESLKRMDLLPEETLAVQAFDVTDKVMTRVHQKSRLQPGWTARKRLRHGIAIPVMLLIFVVGLSVTGYAASQYLEFRNSKGDVILNTETTEEKSEFLKKYTQLFGMYEQLAQDQLQPGEYAAYYVKDDFMNSADKTNPVKFVYKWPEISSFSGLQDEIKRTRAPALNNISHLPNGYHFDFGYAYPAYMFPKPAKMAEYRALTDELVRKAESAPAGEKVFVKKLNWSKADFTLAKYVKGHDYISVMVHTLDPASKKMTVFLDEQDSAEKLRIHGTEVFYISSDETGQTASASKNRLGWRDDSKHLYYEIFDNQDSELTKKDLVKIAEDLLASH
ncbi:DUF4367 domain-containing protein [Paenibacillus jiagnxiensis]|uniref:DUF4367 domain-containing protein n=1 Tax=Paenibacillus jiagnxiensis TaxID=3228926 RepID=UPI0033B83513